MNNEYYQNQTLYDVLGVKKDASSFNIERARNRALFATIGMDTVPYQMRNKIENAYMVLSNPEKRKEYDAYLESLENQNLDTQSNVDLPTQEEPTQEEPTQEEPTQEEPTQEEPTQEEPTQEEATANQVDQYGGYTGMKPKDFKQFVEKLAKLEDYPIDRIILGGDHLGPLTFAHLNEEEAMKEAKTLVHDYVKAGFSKIHIDTSMKVKDDDPNTRLTDETISRRGASLAKVCEEAYEELLKENPNAIHPVYVVGSEVPIPGGRDISKQLEENE